MLESERSIPPSDATTRSVGCRALFLSPYRCSPAMATSPSKKRQSPSSAVFLCLDIVLPEDQQLEGDPYDVHKIVLPNHVRQGDGVDVLVSLSTVGNQW